MGPDGKLGYTWNPLTGCNHGCFYCYARRMAQRMKGRYGYPAKNPFAPTFHEDRLYELNLLDDPTGVFVCSMSDLFGQWVATDTIHRIVEKCRENPRHVYYFLTKDIIHLDQLVQDGLEFPAGAFVGVTIDFLTPIKHIDLRSLPGRRFISFEPLLRAPPEDLVLKGIDWAIVGAMTGPKAITPNDAWTLRLVDILSAHGIPYFIKDNMPWGGPSRPRDHPITAALARKEKKATTDWKWF